VLRPQRTAYTMLLLKEIGTRQSGVSRDEFDRFQVELIGC